MVQSDLFPGTTLIRRETFIGPLPSPISLAEYERLLPGMAGRLITSAEAEGEHRRALERRLVRLSEWGLLCGTLVTLVTLLGGFRLLWAGKTLAGLTPVLTAILGLLAVLVLRRGVPPPADAARGAEPDTTLP
ncbi:MAG TPA: DUF2335 domain-containing protein [Longimicrobium sp.]|nr:DUF2335 domain-containing protein [Longimicrobium sp.]